VLCRRDALVGIGKWASGLGLSLSLLACDAELYHDLSERHVNEALLSLRQAGISADKKPSGRTSRGASYTLTVPRHQEARALTRLGEQGLPGIEPRPASGGKLAFLPSEARSEQLAQRELALSETLESLPQVSHARVHLAFAEPDPLLPTAQLRPTASVLLRVRGPLTLKPGELAELVAHAVVGLSAEDVTVLTTQVASPILPEGGSGEVRSLLLPGLGALCGLLVATVVALAVALRRSRRRDDKPQGTEHALHALTGS